MGRITLECPSCHWTFEAETPDSSHLAHSLRRPRDYNVLEQEFVCQNPKCGKSFVVYWFAPVRLIAAM